jgi:hypothetical protein
MIGVHLCNSLSPTASVETVHVCAVRAHPFLPFQPFIQKYQMHLGKMSRKWNTTEAGW